MKLLIKTEVELKNYCTVNMGLSIASITPFLTMSVAENEVIKVVTEDLYATLLDAYDTGSIDAAGNEHLKALLPYVAKPLANLAIYYYLQEGGVHVDDGGITSVAKDKRAYQWQQNKLEASLLNTAYFSLDRLVKYLAGKPDDFPDWNDSFKNSREFYINDPVTFQKYVNIKESYRTLIALQPSMRNVEAGELESLLSPGLSVKVRNNLNASAPDEDLTQLLRFVLPATAYLTIAEGIMDINMEITPDGAFVHSLKAGYDNIEERKTPERVELDAARDRMLQRGREWLTRLKDFLNANATSTKYADYYNSDNYEDPNKESSTYEQNEISKSYNAL